MVGINEIGKKNDKGMKDFTPVLFGAIVFWIYYNIFFEDIFNLPYKWNLLLVGIFALIGGGIGMFLHRQYLRKNKKKKKIFLWSIIIIALVILVIGFLLKIFLR